MMQRVSTLVLALTLLAVLPSASAAQALIGRGREWRAWSMVLFVYSLNEFCTVVFNYWFNFEIFVA